MRRWIVLFGTLFALCLLGETVTRAQPLLEPTCKTLARDFAELERVINGKIAAAKLNAELVQDLTKLKKQLLDDTWWGRTEWALLVQALSKFSGHMMEVIAIAAGPNGEAVKRAHGIAEKAIESWKAGDAAGAAKALAANEVTDFLAKVAGDPYPAIVGIINVMTTAYQFKDLQAGADAREKLRRDVQKQLKAIDAEIDAAIKRIQDAERRIRDLEETHRRWQAMLRTKCK
jgi:hypothetical protein